MQQEFYLAIEEKVKQTLAPYFNTPKELLGELIKEGEFIDTEKDQILKRRNTTEHFMHFIIQGSGGILIMKGKKIACIDLSYEGEFLSDYMSFFLVSKILR